MISRWSCRQKTCIPG